MTPSVSVQPSAMPQKDDISSETSTCLLDDIFDTETHVPVENGHAATEGESDVARLREILSTHGYRDGVTAGKAESVQRGFDDGYRFGCLLGLRAGLIFGVIDGLLEAYEGAAKLPSPSSHDESLLEELKSIRTEADVDLQTEKLQVDETVQLGDTEQPNDSTELEALVSLHPAIAHWTAVLKTFLIEWSLPESILDGLYSG